MPASQNRLHLSGACVRWRRRRTSDLTRALADESAEVYMSLEVLLANEPVSREAAAS